jgi:hypothetical protein
MHTLTKHENVKHDHAEMPMKIYKMKSFTKQITVEVIQQTIKKMDNAIEELREMNLQDLYTKLQLTDNEFDEWLIAWDYAWITNLR